MKKILIILVMQSSISFAAEDSSKLKDIYLEFESAYMSNNVVIFSPWLSEDYKISQTLHIPGVGEDTRPVSKEQLLTSMEAMGIPNSTPLTDPQNISIEIISSTDFCGVSETVTTTKVSGKDYEEKEIRKICFSMDANSYKALTHNIDVYFNEL